MPVIHTRPGAKIAYNGEEVKVVTAKGFDALIVQTKGGAYLEAPISALLDEHKKHPKPVGAADPIRAAKAPAYIEALKPVLEPQGRTRAAVAACAAKLGITVSSAYRALARHDLSGKAADLPPPTRNGGRGKSRLPAGAETIVQAQIKQTLLTRRNYPVKKFRTETKLALKKAGFAVSETTLRNRVAAIPDYEWTKSRSGYSKARGLHGHAGHHPEVKSPLERVQIDHWRTDIDILDDDRLTIIGRPWATIAIDLHTLTILGMHVGLDSPSVTTVAMCMINAMTRKEPMLQRLGIEADMPNSGKPKMLVMDNAGEFRGKAVDMSCKHFGIHPLFRPVAAPQYGQYIERFNRTLADAFKELAGATGSNPAEREEFRPEKTAAYTLEDLTKEMWMLVDDYHHFKHQGLGGARPIEKWKNFYFAPDGTQRHELPAIYVDDDDLRINWYPLTYRSLQSYGILIDYLEYYSEAIEYLVRNRKDHGRVAVRRDPFDVRRIFLLHPKRNEWITVPTRHLSFPLASLFELQQAKREARAAKVDPSPADLAERIERRRAHAEQAIKKTRTAAREEARRAHHQRMRKPAAKSPDAPTSIHIVEPPTTNPPKVVPFAPKPAAVSTQRASNQDFATLLSSVTDDDIEAEFDDI